MTSTDRSEAIAPAAVFVIGLLTILGAWGFEIFGGYVPCALCLEQRLPYYVGVPLAAASAVAAFAGARPVVVRSLLLAAGLAFLVGVYLGSYHAGVEWKFWAGPADCAPGGGDTSGPIDLDDLNSMRIVPCDRATWTFAGLSFAGWNAVISLFLAGVAFANAFRGRSGAPGAIGEAGR